MKTKLLTFFKVFLNYIFSKREDIGEELKKLGGYLLAVSILAPFIQPETDGNYGLAFLSGIIIVVLGIICKPSNKNTGG